MAQIPEYPAVAGDPNPQRLAWGALPKRLFVAFSAFDALFVLAYFALVAAHTSSESLFQILNLDKEATLPSWYSGMQYFVVAIGYLVLGSRLVPDRRRVRVLRPLWLALGIGFTLLSADEVGAAHERMGRALRRFDLFDAHIFNVKGLDQWMVLYALIGICLMLVFSRQILRAWREWRFEVLLFCLGFTVLACGAFVTEMAQIMLRLEGKLFLLEVGIEEWLEMFGVTILILPAYRILSYAMISEPDTEDSAISEG